MYMNMSDIILWTLVYTLQSESSVGKGQKWGGGRGQEYVYGYGGDRVSVEATIVSSPCRPLLKRGLGTRLRQP